MKRFETIIHDEKAMQSFAAKMATLCNGGEKIYLAGELGAGKTTFARGFLHGLGFEGPVKSPTFTFIEPYELHKLHVYHFDLYRIVHPQELEMLGFRDYFNVDSICLIEWPENGAGILPRPDITCYITKPEQGRKLCIEHSSPQGRKIVAQLLDE